MGGNPVVDSPNGDRVLPSIYGDIGDDSTSIYHKWLVNPMSLEMVGKSTCHPFYQTVPTVY